VIGRSERTWEGDLEPRVRSELRHPFRCRRDEQQEQDTRARVSVGSAFWSIHDIALM